MESRTEKPVGQDLMIYDAAEDSVRILNPTARLVLEQRRAGSGPEAIEAALRARFAVVPGQDVAGDVARILGELRAQGLVD
ncbi:MAG TPA: PqqD family protein [Holophaga sp.]|nr:PqqD family protein [Holophaga sp.]